MADETQDQINDREWNRIENWSGPFGSYSSKADTRLWVPKRPMTGTGSTLNFGQTGAKTAVAAMFVPAAAVVVMLVLLYFFR